MYDSIALAILASQQRQNLPQEEPEQVVLKTMKHVQPVVQEDETE